LRRADTLERIAGAKVLLNVSPAEGFPNTFLEAWALGTPVVSLSVDPAGVISRYGLGFVCGGDMEVLFRLLRSGVFTVDPARLSGYVRDHHSMVAAARLFAAAAQEAGYKRGLEKEAIAI
jgi:glycosyltransferase involved in cell wall biosynthesis